MFETQSYRIYLDSNVLHLQFFDLSDIDLDTALTIEKIIKKNSNSNKILKLIDARGSFNILPEAEKHFMNQRNKSRVKAQAILISSHTKQQTMDFFLEMNSKKLSTKLFVDYDAAINWLKCI